MTMLLPLSQDVLRTSLMGDHYCKEEAEYQAVHTSKAFKLLNSVLNYLSLTP